MQKTKISRILAILSRAYPEAGISLSFENPFQLLISTILSAQCTDKRVNLITPALFAKYKNAKDFANAKQSELEKHIHSTGFYRNKAKNIINCCKMLVAHYWGKVPLSMQELVCLPGVGRKTANIVLSNSGIIEGIAVDTHVARVSRLLGWTKSKNPLIIERDLMRLFSKSDWHLINALLVWHGRRVCVARKPKCGMCLLKNLCPSAGR